VTSPVQQIPDKLVLSKNTWGLDMVSSERKKKKSATAKIEGDPVKEGGSGMQ
jgi:hypothetical protein